MDPTHLLTQTAVITSVVQNDAAPDEYGDPTDTTTNTTVACWLHQVARNEQPDSQGQTWAIYFPSGTTVNASDHVAVDGVYYEVDGPPWNAHNPRRQTISHVEATLRRVT